VPHLEIHLLPPDRETADARALFREVTALAATVTGG
jgi:hypothetical protein